METENLPPTESPSFVDALRRSKSDRMVAGVSGGLAAHWRVDPVIVRIGFVVLTFIGLAGVILYGALWLVIAEEGQEHSIAGQALGVNNEHQLRNAGLIGAMVLAFAAVVGDSGWGLFWVMSWLVIPTLALYWFFVVRPQQAAAHSSSAHSSSTHSSTPQGTAMSYPSSPPDPGAPDTEHTVVMNQPPTTPPPTTPPPTTPREPKSWAIVGITLSLAAIAVGVIAMFGLTTGDMNRGPGLISAVVLAIVGLGLIVGAWRGDAGWLIPVGVLATGALVLSVGFSSIFGGAWGSAWVGADRGHQVESSYEHGLGEFTLDLSSVPAEELAGRTVSIDTGMGVTRVYVPHDLAVDVDADLSAGEIRLFDRADGGAPMSSSYVTPGSASNDRLTIDIHHTFGQIEVDHR